MNHHEIRKRQETIKQLKRERKHSEAIKLLEEWIEITEQEARDEGMSVAPWPYKHLAIVLRKEKDYEREVAVLERFVQQPHGRGAMVPKLFDRLQRAYELAGIEHDGEPEVLQGTAAVVDTETTGFSYDDELIEIGMVLFRYNRQTGEVLKIVEEYTGLREPSSMGAHHVHHISNADVAGQRIDTMRVTSMLEKSDFVLAHNASFDRRFVSDIVPDAEAIQWYCTMNGVKWEKLGYRSKGLQRLLDDHEITVGNSHRALDDAKAVLELVSCTDVDEQPYLSHVLRYGPLSPPKTKKRQHTPSRQPSQSQSTSRVMTPPPPPQVENPESSSKEGNRTILYLAIAVALILFLLLVVIF